MLCLNKSSLHTGTCPSGSTADPRPSLLPGLACSALTVNSATELSVCVDVAGTCCCGSRLPCFFQGQNMYKPKCKKSKLSRIKTLPVMCLCITGCLVKGKLFADPAGAPGSSPSAPTPTGIAITTFCNTKPEHEQDLLDKQRVHCLDSSSSILYEKRALNWIRQLLNDF